MRTLFQNSPEGALWLVINLVALGLDALKDGGTVTCSVVGAELGRRCNLISQARARH